MQQCPLLTPLYVILELIPPVLRYCQPVTLLSKTRVVYYPILAVNIHCKHVDTVTVCTLIEVARLIYPS